MKYIQQVNISQDLCHFWWLSLSSESTEFSTLWAKNVQSLLEWIWPSPLLDGFYYQYYSVQCCASTDFNYFFLRPLCPQEIIRKDYKHAIIMLDEWDLFWYFGPNDPSLPSFQGMNCLLMFVKCHWQRTLSVALYNRAWKWFNISKLSGTHTVADFLKSIFDKVIQSYVLKLYYATCSGVCHRWLVLPRAHRWWHIPDLISYPIFCTTRRFKKQTKLKMNKYQKRQGMWKALFNLENNSNSKDLDVR